MHVESWTNSPGSYYLNEVVGEGGYDGFDEHGNTFNYKYPVSFTTGYQTKTHNLSPGRGPKEYVRFIARQRNVRPFVYRESGVGGNGNPYEVNYYSFPSEFLEPDYGAREGILEYNCESCSITKALNKLRTGDKIQLVNDAIEARKTLSMISNATTSLIGAYRSARRGNWGLAASHLGITPGRSGSNDPTTRWLEYQYGWKPLMGDIIGGIKNIQTGMRRDPLLQQFVAKGVCRDQEQRHDTSYGRDRELTLQILVKTQYAYRISSSVLDAIDTFGVINPLSIAWEAVPFSFVVDWFVPIGNTLEALTATAGLEFVSGSRSYVHYKTLESRGPESVSPDPHFTVVDRGSYGSHSFYFRRIPLGNFEMPRLYANTHPFSTPRVASAISLIRQLVRSR